MAWIWNAMRGCLGHPARRKLAELGYLQPGATLPVDGFTAGYTGHLYPGRGASLLLDLADHLPEVSFMIAGGEPQDVARLRKRR